MDGKSRGTDPLAAVLAPAIDATRRALVQRDANDVPHALRRVSQASGPRLAPPLLRKLLEHLDEDERLRQEAAELLDDAEGPAGAFLLRPSGWWRVVVGAVVEVAEQQAGGRLDGLRRRLEATQGELDTTRARLDEARERHDELARGLKAARADTAERIEAHRQADTERIAALERRVREIEQSEESGIAEIERLEKDLATLRRRSARVRPASTDDGRSERLPGVGGDPMEIARSLDLGFAMLSRRRAGRVDGSRGVSPAVELEPPGGLRPTDPAWFDWLTSIDAPLWLVVDGHNVVFSISEDRSLIADSMRRLETALRRLRTRSIAPLRISLIYDSNLGGDRRAPQALGGLDLRFAPQHSIADDEIVELVESAQTPVIVVTSDRELQSRVAAKADLVIDAIALAGFAGPG